MISKIKDNLALIVTAITLLGSVGAGIQSLNAVLTTLSNIDERMNSIEYEFTTLKESTYVQNDIAVLYEKIYDLEEQAQQLEYLAGRIGFFDSEINNIKQRLGDLEWKFDDENNFVDSQAYELQKWEWQDLLRKITVIETNQLETWEIDNIKDRLTYLETSLHNH
tara:strand:- start:4223 stop:4717 length:495 start_codon:yes stop_codon:yes gene_type:complete